MNDQFPQYMSADQTNTEFRPHREAVNQILDETESEREFEMDSVRVQSKPSPIVFDESIHMQKQQSMTPIHQASKTLEPND